MAKKEEFLEELRVHIQGLQSAIDEMSGSITANNATVATLQADRNSAIDGHAKRVLPDLRSESFAVLEGWLPECVTEEQSRRLLKEMQAGYQAKIDQLLTSYDPTRYEQNNAKCSHELRTETQMLETLLETRSRLNNIPRFTQLLRSGYGSPDYGHGWLSLQYYKDWKDADETVASAGVSDWKALVQKWREACANVESTESDVAVLRAKSESLTAKQDTYKDLKSALENAPVAVLEQLRIKVKARIDSAVEPIVGMKDLIVFQRRISETQEKNAEIQRSRLVLTEQLTELFKLKVQAVKSKARTVPEEFVTALRRAPRTSYGGSGNGSSSVTHVHHHDNGPGLLQTVLYLQMFDHFGHDHGHHDSGASTTAHGTSSDNYYNETRDAAINDKSGQS